MSGRNLKAGSLAFGSKVREGHDSRWMNTRMLCVKQFKKLKPGKSNMKCGTQEPVISF
jgi:hypothetical protein